MAERMTVWVDQAQCTGCMLCQEIAPTVFRSGEDGFVQVKASADPEDSRLLPAGPEGIGLVPLGNEATVQEAYDCCPGGGEDIFMLGKKVVE